MEIQDNVYNPIWTYRSLFPQNRKKDYKDYRDNFVLPVNDIGTQKMAYIGHRNKAQPSSIF